LRRYKAKCVKTRCFQEGVGQFEPTFQGEAVVPRGSCLVDGKLDTFCYLSVETVSSCVQSFWHNTGVWQTDRRTDGFAIASTALAMRALRRAVKILRDSSIKLFCLTIRTWTYLHSHIVMVHMVQRLNWRWQSWVPPSSALLSPVSA